MSSRNRQAERSTEESAAATENAEQPMEQALEATQESLDKVRDILFGSQLRTHDRRFENFEAKVAADLASLRKETQESLQNLQTFFQGEFSTLTSRLAAESTQRQETQQAFRTELQALVHGAEKHAAALDQQHTAAEASLRAQALETSNALREEAKATAANLQATIEKLVGELRGAKTDRAALAGLFTEMAGRLQN
jgi:hypothetical protein